MIFYEVAGQHLVATQAEAKATGLPWDQIDIPTDKPGLMAYLNRLMLPLSIEHPALPENLEGEPSLNGGQALIAEPHCPFIPETVNYADFTTKIDEVFLNLPVDHQLMLAGYAIENARTRIEPAQRRRII